MKLSDISPKLIGAYKLDYNKNIQPKKMFSLKTHTCFRFIYVLSGNVTIEINSKKHIAQNGTIIYMPPYARYRFIKKSDNLSLINVFFTMTEDESLKSNILIYVDDNSLPTSFSNYFEEGILNDYIIENKPELESAIIKLTSEADSNKTFTEKCTLLYLISSLISVKDNKRQTVADKVTQFIKNNVENGVNADSLASEFSYHKNYLSSLIKNQTGLSLGEYVLKEKIARAKTLILNGELTLIEISNRLGFYDYSHFYKAFKKETGISPTHFAK